MSGLRRQLSESAAAFRSVVANTNLRRLEAAWLLSVLGQWAYGVSLAVFAFKAGGASAVGIVWLARMVPSALASPFVGLLADRFSRVRVMLASNVLRAILVGAAAIAIWSGVSSIVVYALAVAASIAQMLFRPAQAALVPSLAETPAELTAANVVASTIESVGFFGGPALAGIMLAFTGAGTVFAVTAVAFVASALFVLLIDAPREPEARAAARGSVVHEALAGFRTVGSDVRLTILVGLITAVTFVVGIMQVLEVATALDLLDLGQSGVGWFNAAFGVGALLGAFVSLPLVGVRRLSVPFLIGVVLWGAPAMLIAAVPRAWTAIVFLGVIGIGNTLVDVAGFTLVQRIVPDAVLARVFGVIQMLWMGTVGIGAAIASPLISGLNIRGALLVTGAFLPALVAVLGLPLLRIDAQATAPDPDELRLLQRIPIFAPLPGTALEHLAGRLAPLRYPAGTDIMRQGERGDRFYVLAEGSAEVIVDERTINIIHAGEYFGEIALLRDIPRTATVRAITGVEAYALDRDEFIAAVTGHSASKEAAETVIGTRLGTVPGIA